MTLIYRGQPYDSRSCIPSRTYLNHQGCFRGISYLLTQPGAVSREVPGFKLKFLGQKSA